MIYPFCHYLCDRERKERKKDLHTMYNNPNQQPGQGQPQWPPQEQTGFGGQQPPPYYQQQPYYQPPMPPPPPKKKHTALWIILGVIGVLLFACVGASIVATNGAKNAASTL